jgi:hypothetical protein
LDNGQCIDLIIIFFHEGFVKLKCSIPQACISPHNSLVQGSELDMENFEEEDVPNSSDESANDSKTLETGT